MGDVLENISKNIAKLRKSKGWTQEMLADFSGLSQNAITAIENKKAWPGIATVRKLAAALSVSEEELFLSSPLKPKPTKEELLEKIAESYGINIVIEKPPPEKPPNNEKKNIVNTKNLQRDPDDLSF